MKLTRTGAFAPAAAALLALALLAGCGDDDASETPEPDSGSTASLSGTTVEGDGYSFELAEGFEEGETEGLAESLGDAAAGATVDALATGETVNAFTTNVNVVITDAPSDDLDAVVEESLEGLQASLDSLGISGTEIDVSVEPFETTLGGEDARQYDFETTTDGAVYAQRQVVVLRDDQAYTITFSADGDSFDDAVTDFEAMTGTWEWSG